MGKDRTKSIIFNYFKGTLVVDRDIYDECLREYRALENINRIKNSKKLNKRQKELLQNEKKITDRYKIYEKFGSEEWDALTLFKWISENQIDTNIDISEFVAEIEPNTLLIKENIVSFQISKLRDNLLPAKKKKGKNKIDIDLDDDEYIGEFVSILYDANKNIFMIQSNIYGLSYNQLSKYFTLLRRKVIKTTNNYNISSEFKYPEYLSVEFVPVIGELNIPNIMKSKEIRKLRVRGYSFNLCDFSKNSKSILPFF